MRWSSRSEVEVMFYVVPHSSKSPDVIPSWIGLSFSRLLGLAILTLGLGAFGATGGGEANPFFTATSNGFPALISGSIAVADFDNDGRMDLVAAGSSKGFPELPPVCELWRNTGAGFERVPVDFPRLYSCSLVWGDVDNDGRVDLALSGLDLNAAFFCEVWRNTPTGFSRLTHLNAVFGSGDPRIELDVLGKLEFADLDRDGLLDLLIMPKFDGFLFPAVWRNTGSGFQSLKTALPTTLVGSSATTDIDGDGFLDIALNGVVKGSPDYSVTEIWRNTASGFQKLTTFPATWDGPVAITDFNQDGSPDVSVGGSSAAPYDFAVTNFLLLNATGGFVPANVGPIGFGRGSFVWGDFDNDGRADLLATGITNNQSFDFHTAVLKAGTSGLSNVWSAFVGSGEHVSAWIDSDADGRLDVIHSGQDLDGNGAIPTRLWHNTVPIANTPPSAPTNLSATTNGNELVLRWSEAGDKETPVASLSYNVRVGTTPGGGEILSPMAGPTGSRRVHAVGNAHYRKFIALEIPLNRKYYWSVQAIDAGYLGGAFAPEQTVPADSTDTQVRITSAERLPDGKFSLRFDADRAGSFSVEAADALSLDPPTAWRVLGQATVEGPGSYSFVDQSQPGVPTRFYRISATAR